MFEAVLNTASLDAEARPSGAAPCRESSSPRLMLHAYHVELAHPAAGRPAAFTARVPKDMREFWALCRSGKQPAT
ncbi:MAG TPA: hypothetical protein DEB40_07195 [Elusimicrobia bacterium]|nr:hypothetical protein [Elusimicrobiota bacterium]HBT61513.1 hypothetical protein [Elusimicrobiota bacterium]